jgi:hypothetical protein
MRDLSCAATLDAISPDDADVAAQRAALSELLGGALAGPSHMVAALQQQYGELLQLDVERYAAAWCRAGRPLEEDLREVARWQQVGAGPPGVGAGGGEAAGLGRGGRCLLMLAAGCC